ncbi:glycosyltransferase family protein [Formosa sp. 3Alg 14/1]|uniref:hypothetical protein n=1 Tax=Formosa sp. 3Alg 14/1 TaxID=3382190 RepID=UPI0039BE3E0A
MKNVLFILSGNLSTTPRAVKAIQTLPAGVNCEVVMVNRSKLWKDKDVDIINDLNVKVNYLELGRSPLVPWIKATFYQKLATILYKFKKDSVWINGFASNKSAIILHQFLKKQEYSHIDLIMGHSGGSMFPGYMLSQIIKAPFLFDVEDYHPGESISSDAINEKQRREDLMKFILPKANAITYASPLIGEYTLKLIGGHHCHELVLNGFKEKEFIAPKEKGENDRLKLVWFSQKVGYGRGLENLFEALLGLKSLGANSIKLVLIGEMDDVFFDEKIKPNLNIFKENNVEIECFPALPQPQLHNLLSTFDVGLALEFNEADFNRELCLTNKIITYAQAGLYIFATNTKAQVQFIEKDKNLGIICNQTTFGVQKSLKKLINNEMEIRSLAVERFRLGKKFSWEQESKKLENMWNQLLKK